MDYYKTLGVNKNANQEDIRKAYKNLAIKWHPDKNKDTMSLQKFKEISEAYQVLSDPIQKRDYDMKKFVKFQQRNPFDLFNEIFSMVGGLHQVMGMFNTGMMPEVHIQVIEIQPDIEMLCGFGNQSCPRLHSQRPHLEYQNNAKDNVMRLEYQTTKYDNIVQPQLNDQNVTNTKNKIQIKTPVTNDIQIQTDDKWITKEQNGIISHKLKDNELDNLLKKSLGL